MLQVFKKITALLFIPIFLWAGAGFSLSRHYCLGMLVEESLYFQSESCQADVDNHQDKDCSEDAFVDHQSCCDDEWLNVSNVEVQKQNERDYALPKIEDLKAGKSLKGLSCGETEFILNAKYLDPNSVPMRGDLNPELSKYLAEIQAYLI